MTHPLLFSRRRLLRQAGAGGAAIAGVAVAGATTGVPLDVFSPVSEAVAQEAARTPAREPLETLTPAEAAVLEAIAARLIPTDETGPGAADARAAHYIDRALGGALAGARESYRSGLASVDAYARTARGGPFAELRPSDQDALLTDMERGVASGFSAGSAAFFNLVLGHVLQGTFCDPHYGGNRNFVGWDLLGYPGVRLAVNAEQQRLDPTLSPTHMSAYDYSMFAAGKPGRGQ
jgi:gluconate 2-dehydrogenase gamma chain